MSSNNLDNRMRKAAVGIVISFELPSNSPIPAVLSDILKDLGEENAIVEELDPLTVHTLDALAGLEAKNAATALAEKALLKLTSFPDEKLSAFDLTRIDGSLHATSRRAYDRISSIVDQVVIEAYLPLRSLQSRMTPGSQRNLKRSYDKACLQHTKALGFYQAVSLQLRDMIPSAPSPPTQQKMYEPSVEAILLETPKETPESPTPLPARKRTLQEAILFLNDKYGADMANRAKNPDFLRKFYEVVDTDILHRYEGVLQLAKITKGYIPDGAKISREASREARNLLAHIRHSWGENVPAPEKYYPLLDAIAKRYDGKK